MQNDHNMARKYKQGRFVPLNPKKYMGDATNIIYRSSWELKFLKKLDESPNVMGYVSEEVVIPYFSPVDMKMHRYFVDILVVSNTKQVTLIEIKPWAQTQPPKTSNRKKSTVINETMTYMVNCAKWEAAINYCKKKGWAFKIVTEKDLNF